MCGIAGFIGQRLPQISRTQATLSAMHHRGPDANGTSTHELNKYQLQLLHTRLAIIDKRVVANQPFSRNGVTLVFNGEIYNYLELRDELKQFGFIFQTRSDTEILICAYLKWGEACLNKLEGMWAFLLFDQRREQVMISRDRFGEKPLFFMQDNGNLYLASETRALAELAGQKPIPNMKKLAQYLVGGFRFIHKTNDTFFETIQEFPAAHFAWIENPYEINPKPYWQLIFNPVNISRDQVVAQVKEKFVRAVSQRLRSDVPLAFCLSGGVDSSSLVGVADSIHNHNLSCFSVIDHDPRYDESDNISLMVETLNCQHWKVYPEQSNFLDELSHVAASHDGPIPTINYYLHAFLLKEIARQGFKVSISGTAADEIFTGYYDHYAMWLAYMGKRVNDDPTIDVPRLITDWEAGYGLYVRNPILRDPEVFRTNEDMRMHLMEDAEKFSSILNLPWQCHWVEKKYCDDLLRNRMMNELFKEIVPTILAADDRNAMRFSIENRSPFLDRELVELMCSVPNEHLINNGLAKSILRDAVIELVPDKIRLDPRKRGFNASIDSLIDRKNPETRARLLDDSPLFEIVNRNKLESLLDSDMSANSYSKFMFRLVSTRAFLECQSEWQLKTLMK